MKIVIDIDEKDYQSIKNGHIPFSVLDVLMNGTPLPEHHGRLIDANVLKKNIHYVPIAPIFQGDYVTYRNVIFADILDMLPTIIEGSESE